jgi:Sulfotransferase family
MRGLLGRLLSAPCRARPVFVSGAARSGTTIVIQALGRHPDLAAPLGEAPYLLPLGRAAHALREGPGVEYVRDSLRLPRQEVEDRLRRLAFEVAAGGNLGLETLVRHATRHRGALPKRWCARCSPEEDAALGLLALFPAARFVDVVRNGLEVVASRQRFAAFRDLPFEAQCGAWARSVSRSAFLVSRSDTIRVRHEDLLARPEETLGRVLAELGVRYHPGPAQFARSTHLHPLDEPSAFGVAVQARLAAREAPHANWSAEQRATFKSLCGDAMRQAGYGVPF